MSGTTGRVLMALAVAVCLLGIGVLEVLSERVQIDRAFTTTLRPSVTGPEPAWDALASAEGSDPTLDASHPTMPLPTGRVTVLTVDEKARRLLSMNDTGRVVVSDLSNAAVVVTEDRKSGPLALVKPGDVVRIEPPAGQIQKIVLLRHGWEAIESPER